MDFLIGIFISFMIAGIAYKKQSLNVSGFFSAILFGALIYVFGGLLLWACLIGFFISSSLLTKLHQKKDNEQINVQKKGRNYVQVISNALVATIFSLLYFLLEKEIYLIAAVVSIATSNADTWASEIGILSKGKTFSILNFKLLKKGSSGAVSVLGLMASIMGAAFIAFIFTVFYSFMFTFDILTILIYMFIIIFGGFLGSIVDSFLGLLIQAKYKGKKTGVLSEVKHMPNEQTILISGLAFITNDMVNFLSGLASSIVTILLFMG